MEEEQIQKEINSLKNLPQYKNKNEEFLRAKAISNIQKRNSTLSQKFTDSEEKVYANELYGKYLTEFPDFSFNELQTLEDLIYEEVYKLRLQKKINELHETKKSPQLNLTKQLHQIEDRISDLKQKLKIEGTDGQDELTGLQILKKKFEKYINEHKNEFTVPCAKCGTLLLLRKRIKDFDCIKHPWFAGRWFFNYEILKDVKDNKLNKEDAWRYMICASQGGDYKPAFTKKYCIDYINYCLKNWKEITACLK